MPRFRVVCSALALLSAVVALIPVVQAEAAISKRVFFLPTSNSQPGAPLAGPDGNIWFLEDVNNVGRITSWGKITEFPLGTSAAHPSALIVGPDGKTLWVAEPFGIQNAVLSVSMAGVVTEYQLPTPNAYPGGIAAGSDGRIWIVEQNANKIAALDPATAGIVEYASPVSAPVNIASGSDGRLWIISQSPPSNSLCTLCGTIAAMTTTGQVGLITAIPGRSVSAMTLGPDGALWIPGGFLKIVDRVTTTGKVTKFAAPGPGRVTAGPNGLLFLYRAGTNGGYLDSLTTTGTFTQITALNGGPSGVAVGTDGSYWVTEVNANAIARIRVT